MSTEKYGLDYYEQLFDRYVNAETLLERDKNSFDIVSYGREILEDNSDKYALNTQKRDEKIIVSLTTIPDRIENVDVPIRCMLLQSLKPDRIVLWIDKDRVTLCDLPEHLKQLLDFGLEIQFVDDIGPHTKYYYAFQKYTEAVVITIDDDCYYRTDLINRLYESHQRNKNKVIACDVWDLPFSKNGIPYPTGAVKKSSFFDEDTESSSYFAQGVGGVLYPTSLKWPIETFDCDQIRRNALKADDIWLKAMEIKGNILTVKLNGKYRVGPVIIGSQGVSLRKDNLTGRNDMILKKVFLNNGLLDYYSGSEHKLYEKEFIYRLWVKAYQNDLNIGKYLEEKGISTVAIYGVGELGKMLFKEFVDGIVDIKYAIDNALFRGYFNDYSFPVFSPDNICERVDLIIVTAPVTYSQIYNTLNPIFFGDIILLDDLLAEMIWES